MASYWINKLRDHLSQAAESQEATGDRTFGIDSLTIDALKELDNQRISSEKCTNNIDCVHKQLMDLCVEKFIDELAGYVMQQNKGWKNEARQHRAGKDEDQHLIDEIFDYVLQPNKRSKDKAEAAKDEALKYETVKDEAWKDGAGKVEAGQVGAAGNQQMAVSTQTDYQVVQNPRMKNIKGTWILWLYWRQPFKTYCSSFTNLTTFKSPEDFNMIANALTKPSGLCCGTSYSVMKNNVAPSWKEPPNAGGGSWTLEIPHDDDNGLDTYWMTMVTSLLDYAWDNTYVCGFIISVNKHSNKVKVWTSPASHFKSHKISEIGDLMLRIVPIMLKSYKFYYRPHPRFTNYPKYPKYTVDQFLSYRSSRWTQNNANKM